MKDCIVITFHTIQFAMPYNGYFGGYVVCLSKAKQENLFSATLFAEEMFRSFLLLVPKVFIGEHWPQEVTPYRHDLVVRFVHTKLQLLESSQLDRKK